MHADAAPFVPSSPSQPARPLRAVAPPFFIGGADAGRAAARKPALCAQFNTPSGCRFATGCRFVHERPGDVGVHNAKRGAWAQRQANETARRQRRLALSRADAVVSRLGTLIVDTKEIPAVKKKRARNAKQVAVCKFWKSGYCKRADSCWFSHPGPSAEELEAAKGSDSETSDPFHPSCSVCYDDHVEVYGLLEECSHASCFNCLHKWRTNSGKSQETVENMAKVMKTCPQCRRRSHFITPSSMFYPDSARKKAIIQGYKDVLSNLPCKYLAQSTKANKAPFCPFGDECHYSHTVNGKRIVFHATAAECLPRLKARRRRVQDLDHDAAMILSFWEQLQGRRLPEMIQALAERQDADQFIGVGLGGDPNPGGDDDWGGSDGDDAVVDVLGPDGASITRPREHRLPSGDMLNIEPVVTRLPSALLDELESVDGIDYGNYEFDSDFDSDGLGSAGQRDQADANGDDNWGEGGGADYYDYDFDSDGWGEGIDGDHWGL